MVTVATKHGKQSKEKTRKIYFVALFVVLVLVVATVSYVLVTSEPLPSTSEENDPAYSDNPLSAALVDALYSSLPNDEFTDSLVAILESAGFEVDVFQGSEITVDFLKTMSEGYDLVVFRMHSALHSDDLYLFTAEPYSVNKYSDEQYFRLIKEAYATETSDAVFAVNWGFIKRCMANKFNNTLIVMMGCDGSRDSTLVDEFLNQDALAYISWDGPVSIGHSDLATLQLIRHLYVDDLSVKDATQNTNLQTGSDPEWGSYLECYGP
jgi:hypothetical protein